MIVAIGYLASVFLAVSLLVKNDLQFRWLNMFGCLTFVVYGLMIAAIPIILTNAILFLINIFYLIKVYNTKEAFDLAEFNPSEKIITKFLQFYHNDIERFFPSFKLAGNDNDLRFIVLRDMAIANIFIVSIAEDGTGYVKINYTVPKYRDFKVGSFIFEKEKQYLESKGIKKIVYTSVANSNHEAFLKKMGFIWDNNTANPIMYKPL